MTGARAIAPLLIPLLLAEGCRRPGAVAPVIQPAAILRLAFTDGTVEIGLDRLPPSGAWAWMDAGLWSPLDLKWPAPDRAHADIARTSPDWLVLRDPAGGVHRLVLRDRPDSVPMPTPRRMQDAARLTEEDRETLALAGFVWVLSFVRR